MGKSTGHWILVAEDDADLRKRVLIRGLKGVPVGSRLFIEAIGDDFYRATIRYGFMETPDVPLALMRSSDCASICFDPMDTTYFASRETIVARRHHGMPIWRDKLSDSCIGTRHRQRTSSVSRRRAWSSWVPLSRSEVE